MSGLYLLILIAIWLFVGWLLVIVWRMFALKETHKFTWAVIHVLIGLSLFSAWFGWPFWEMFGKKMYWDAKVRELCATDGGVKVYETVVLPRATYEQLAINNWVLPDKSQKKPTDPYYYESETHYFTKGKPQVTRTVVRVIRQSDGAVLGKYIHYGRGGGDIPGPWHGSSFLCPDPTKSTGFETKIFIKGEQE